MANEMRGRLGLGEFVPLVFWATLVLCGFLYGEYDHLRRLVSELGAIGAPSQYWFMAGLLAGAALFPLPMRLHLWMGLPSVLTILSPLAALLLWHGARRPAGFQPFALGSLALFLLGFIVFMPGVLDSVLGLKQRFFHLGWSLWFVGLARAFRHQAKEGSRP